MRGEFMPALIVINTDQMSFEIRTALAEQRLRYKVQIRDLAAQIRYLKAKFTRESTFRNGLSLQKRYLLVMIGGMSLNEHATLKAIASMGHPVPELERPKRTLKSVALAVISTIRARCAFAIRTIQDKADIVETQLISGEKRFSSSRMLFLTTKREEEFLGEADLQSGLG
jgi:hypothetical protein